jgi:hypothetical protein
MSAVMMLIPLRQAIDIDSVHSNNHVFHIHPNLCRPNATVKVKHDCPTIAVATQISGGGLDISLSLSLQHR